MDHGESSEIGKDLSESLLLDKDKSQLQHQPGHWNAAAIILGFECLQSTAYFGIYTNLVRYLKTVLHGSNASNAANAAIWNGTSFFTSLIGAFIADTFCGNYQTVFFSSLIFLLGLLIITSTSLIPSLRPSPCEGLVPSCLPATTVQTIASFSGLYLMAFGSGGLKGVVLPLGADQFDENNFAEREQKGIFFHWFYVSFTFGILMSGTLIVFVEESIDWPLGFSICTLCLALALSALIISKPVYRLRKPTGSPLKRILQVLVACFSKISSEIPTDTNLLFETKHTDYKRQRLAHTNDFRFLDKAAIVSDTDGDDIEHRNPWKLCTITEVEELKTVLRLLPIWVTGIIFQAAFSQICTTFILRGSAMETRIFSSLSIPPASLSSFEVVSVMFCVLLYNKIIMPMSKQLFRNGAGLSKLQRMGIGRFLIIIVMVTAGSVETIRLKRIKNGNGLTNITWQLPQYFIAAVSDMFNNISQAEFFYDQAPESMKSLCTAFGLLTVALGSYLSSFIITAVQFVTAQNGRSGWISDDLNDGHLDYFFWVFAGICAVNFMLYLAFAWNFTLKRVVI
ncbi:protein NRT1/ PTR FAMILY 8.3-like isoform X2 [Dioscorea cayenensis subsp. rotundata]|uniref:Protein NRT1/ PTR FAMILY 8.3-like isoform X2 n=1 Tax=Dioscorea cayennensis subsp. rotundata TaxID=55577 RepID=A0AB40CUW9_DIOCR|nr:protein NRT1/ PTR FAMILY 8.3-like isoform X2 [Dioscorea cayenensis subsp. rotundata]